MPIQIKRIYEDVAETDGKRILVDDVTDYVICVSFDSKGQVIDISMES